MIKAGDWVKIKDQEIGNFQQFRIPGPYKVFEKSSGVLCVSLMLRGKKESDYPKFEIRGHFELVVPPASEFWELPSD